MNKTQRTPGPYLREERTIYALEHAGWHKGIEQFQNRIYAGFQGGPNTPKEEVEATAAYFQMAANTHEAFLKALDAAETILRCAPNFTSNASGTKSMMGTVEALKMVREAIEKAKGV